MEEKIQSICEGLRTTIRDVGAEVVGLKGHGIFRGGEVSQHGMAEMMANIMLAYRHLEDARMRLGKVMQHADGGVSVYDKREGATSATS